MEVANRWTYGDGINAPRAPGGHTQIPAETVEKIRTSDASSQSSSVEFSPARARRDRVEELAAQVEEQIMRRQLRQIEEEDHEEEERKQEEAEAKTSPGMNHMTS